MIREGKIKLGRRSSDGRENLVAILGPGEMFGELSLFDPGPRTMTATAVAETQLLGLGNEDLNGLLSGRPAVAKVLLAGLAQPLPRTTLAPGKTLPADRLYAIENGPTGFDAAAPEYFPKIRFLMLMRNERLASLHTDYDEANHTLTIQHEARELRADLRTKEGRLAVEAFFRRFMPDELRGPPKVLYGDSHLGRASGSLVSLLESTAATDVFSILTITPVSAFAELKALEGDLDSWKVPSLALVNDTALDAKRFADREAILYLGPLAGMTYSQLPQRLCKDPDYVQMRMERLVLAGFLGENLRRSCAPADPK